MSTLPNIPEVPKVSMLQPPSPVVSKKRMREVSIQYGIQSDIEGDEKQAIQQDAAQQDTFVAPLDLGLPMSRKQRRRQLRSVSKQSITQQAAPLQDIQPRAASFHSKSTTFATAPEADSLEHRIVSAEVPNDAAVLVQITMQDAEPEACKPLQPESPRRAQTEVQIAQLPETPTRPVLKTAYSQPSPLPQTISYAAALAGTKDTQSFGDSPELSVVGYRGKEKVILDIERNVQFECDEQQEDNIPAAAQDFKRKKRIRLRKRRSRQSTSGSTAFSKADDQQSADSGTTFAGADSDNPIKKPWTRQRSIAISNAETLVEYGDASQEEDATSSNAEGARPMKRVRRWSKAKDNIDPVTPESFVLKEEVLKPVEVVEKEQTFIEKIRQMLTYDGQRDSGNPPPTTSPIPMKYLSPTKLAPDSTNPDFTLKIQQGDPEAGPQTGPLMPSSWLEARTWDMTPPVHGNKKTFKDPIQCEKEKERCSEPSRALGVQTYPPLTPSLGTPFGTLWAVSRYLEQKQNFITEHRKREGLRWAVMKAVEKNLDFQKRRESPLWPRNWNVPVEKDREYMQKMVKRVDFLIKKPESC
ncbi:hypothetical protein DL95DRAFT_465673 [Leptodontidium sp. 2 PMI_412]|nr:hypothetical protein DL95DRAFT_465673 [Leptodontidium sp. 2 PMI_412]